MGGVQETLSTTDGRVPPLVLLNQQQGDSEGGIITPTTCSCSLMGFLNQVVSLTDSEGKEESYLFVKLGGFQEACMLALRKDVSARSGSLHACIAKGRVRTFRKLALLALRKDVSARSGSLHYGTDVSHLRFSVEPRCS